MPLTFENSWTNAAETVRDSLITSISTAYAARFGVTPEAERDAWLDFMPARTVCWALFTGGGPWDLASDSEAAPQSMLLTARVEGRFSSREDARAFGMMIAGATPILRSSNVECFRISENPVIEPEYKRLANNKSEALYWKITIPCLLVFRTNEEFP